MRMYPAIAFSILLSLLSEPNASPQPTATSSSPAPFEKQVFPDRNELLRQIKVCEDARRNAEAAHATPETLAKIDVVTGGLYEDAGMYPQSEATLQSAVNLLHDGPPKQLADALVELAMLHTTMRNPRKAEKEDREAIALRESVGDEHGTVLARIDLANAEMNDRHFAQAIADAQAALRALGDENSLADHLAAHQTLGYALTEAGRCREAIPVLKETVQLAKSSFGADSLEGGVDTYLLGHAAWQCGDPADAGAWMQRGIERMKPDLGWGHLVYLDAITDYAKFLRERGQKEQAAAEEREVRTMQSVVDVRTLAPVNGLR